MKHRALLLIPALLILSAAGYGGFRYLGSGNGDINYKFAKVSKGGLTAAVSASGTLNPVVSVQVGSQISGQIRELLVDFNSPVKAGQLIARLDPETYQHRVHQAEADLDAARAAVQVQHAQVLQSHVNLMEAQRDFDRKKLLVEKNFISPAERDKAQTTLDAAKAQRQVAEAQARNSEALVRQREAQLGQARVDLGRTEIRSPVDGIVVKRSVEPGQTVAASLQAPELFIIARTLSDMQVETSIDEADVGRVRVGQKATFTVDAFPGRHFEGEVRQVRKAATVVSNVVSYTVIVSAANPDLTLLPGMTANVRIITAHKDGVLKVPNAALRFKPSGAEPDKATSASTPSGMPGGGPGQLKERLTKDLNLDADQQAKLDAILTGMRGKFAAARDLPEAERVKAMERHRAEQKEKIAEILNADQNKRYQELSAEMQASRTGGSGRLWIVDGSRDTKGIAVRLGITDGTATEIVSGEVTEGMEVIVSAGAPAKAAVPGPRMF